MGTSQTPLVAIVFALLSSQASAHASHAKQHSRKSRAAECDPYFLARMARRQTSQHSRSVEIEAHV